MAYRPGFNRKQYDIAYYQRHKKQQAARVLAVKQRMLEMVRTIKANAGCLHCPEKHPACLDFHHRDRSQKTLEISNCIRHGWGVERLMDEIEKCDVVCKNCHAKLHWSERI